jgi:hypothetical protein
MTPANIEVMRVVHGRVTAGRVELDQSLPDGIEVAVVAGLPEQPFELDEDQIRELEESVAEADRREVVQSPAVLARLGGGR